MFILLILPVKLRETYLKKVNFFHRNPLHIIYNNLEDSLIRSEELMPQTLSLVKFPSLKQQRKS